MHSLFLQTDFSPIHVGYDLVWNTPRFLAGAFMAILFLQSGLDKVFNYQSNMDYFKDHFKNSPLASSVGLMTPMITVLEVLAGACCAIGLVSSYVTPIPFAFWGMALAGLDLLCLFFGQRMAKDYAGAAALVPYFLVALIGLFLASR